MVKFSICKIRALAIFHKLFSSFQSQNPLEDPFVPTSEDLAGFWDMVYIQVEHINSLFADLVELRKNNWTPKVLGSDTLTYQGLPSLVIAVSIP